MHFDVLVVGAGPAGSIAAHVLADAGANVALVDKARFPRDKACGDLVGPRGLRLLEERHIPLPMTVDVGDMLVVGPTGRRVVLPCMPGRTYPGHASAVTRSVFDDVLRTAAIDAGAIPFAGRADQPLGIDGTLCGFRTDTGHSLSADVVIGADGATSHVAETAGLIEPDKVLWGFAVRTYLDQTVALPTIVLWDRTPWHAFPGYGWIFPGPAGGANVGVGVGTLAARRAGADAVRALPDFLHHVHGLGLLDHVPSTRPPHRLGGWLKMGMVGTTPARDRVLLTGDAAGLVNPLQGEGISQAMASGRAAAQAVLAGPDRAAERYRAALGVAHLPYHRIAGTVHAALVGHPRAVAATGRVLTAPGIGQMLAGGWSLFWNELVDGALPGAARSVATASTRLGAVAVTRSAVSRWFDDSYPDHP